MNLRGLAHTIVPAVGSVALAASLCLGGVRAYAATNDDLVNRVEQATAEYRAAEEEVERIEEQIAQNEEKTADIQARLPEQRAKTAASIRNLYKFQQNSPGLLDLLLSAESFNDFISTIRYIDTIHERNTNEVQALVSLERELTQTQLALSADRDVAVQKQEDARVALEQARATKQEAQKRANATVASEATRRGEVLAAVQETINKGTSKTAGSSSSQTDGESGEEATITTKSGNTTKVELPSEPELDTNPIVENTTNSEVSDWAARIDAYLAGTALEGHGAAFAQAAADYGVDPRVSPAISCIESGKGEVCFLPHNAWGWGSASWDDWDSAIRDHVEGYAKTYGSTVTLEGAEMYSGEDIYPEWYSLVLSEMDNI